jgi:uncharacterized protein YggU (UPF0235/DUF167 family)
MARAKADLPSAAAVRALVDGAGRLVIRVPPGARDEAITLDNGIVHVKVRAKPDDGKATAAVMALLAQALGIGVTRLELLRGTASRDKLIKIPPEA